MGTVISIVATAAVAAILGTFAVLLHANSKKVRQAAKGFFPEKRPEKPPSHDFSKVNGCQPADTQVGVVNP
jgi:hypothetical protein